MTLPLHLPSRDLAASDPLAREWELLTADRDRLAAEVARVREQLSAAVDRVNQLMGELSYWQALWGIQRGGIQPATALEKVRSKR